MRILGIDYGDKRIGLAISDRLQLTSQALGQYKSRNKKEDAKYFKELITKYEITEIVIGLPLRMDGTLGDRAKKTKDFAAWLENALKLPIIFWDERLSTQEALKCLNQQGTKRSKKKDLTDQIAAAIILSSYLERQRNKTHAEPQS